jgi:hypothetical protein
VKNTKKSIDRSSVASFTAGVKQVGVTQLSKFTASQKIRGNGVEKKNSHSSVIYKIKCLNFNKSRKFKAET